MAIERKGKVVRVSEEELAALQAYRNSVKATDPSLIEEAQEVSNTGSSNKDLADAFVEAIERTKPPTKKTPFTRAIKTPWYNPAVDGPRLKLKRKMFHHGVAIDEKITNKTIALLNKIKPGAYCDNYITVKLRKDRGLDIDYPVRTASQRLKLINRFGIRGFDELLDRLIAEKENPSKYRKAEDSDLYDLE